MMIFCNSKDNQSVRHSSAEKKDQSDPDLDSKEQKTFSTQTYTHSVALKTKICKRIHIIFCKEKMY